LRKRAAKGTHQRSFGLPKELINARSAYRIASEGPAGQLAPAELHKANEALILAEESFRNDPDSYKTKDLAYAAQRKSELAGALGAMAGDKSSKEKADAAFQKKQTEIVKQGKQDLRDSEKRTAEAMAALAALAAVKKEKRGLVVTLSGSVLFRSAKSTLLSSAKVKLDQVADSVRDYLVQRGYPADRIQARGKGEGSPIADNASAEGRANNRRVEIVIES